MNQVLKNPTMRKNVMTKVGNLLQKEMMKACSAQNKSLFKDKSVSAIEQFHWSNASNELKRVAPSLFALLNTCIPEKSTIDREIGVVVCAGILLRYCSERNNVIQRLFSVLMFASHSPKQVSNTQLL